MVRDKSRAVERIRYMPKIGSTLCEKINEPIEAWQIGHYGAPNWVKKYISENNMTHHYAGLLKGFDETDFVLNKARIYPNGNYVVRLSKDKIIICSKESFEDMLEPVTFSYELDKDCINYQKKSA